MFFTDRKLRDFNFMATQPVGSLYPHLGWGWATRLDDILITVLNRLAHLTYRMEHTPSNETACCAHWYLDHLTPAHVPLPAPNVYVDLYVNRLRRALDAHEARIGDRVYPDEFARLVGYNEDSIRWVLYGPPADVGSPGLMPSFTTPEGKLLYVISQYCWVTGFAN